MGAVRQGAWGDRVLVVDLFAVLLSPETKRKGPRRQLDRRLKCPTEARPDLGTCRTSQPLPSQETSAVTSASKAAVRLIAKVVRGAAHQVQDPRQHDGYPQADARSPLINGRLWGIRTRSCGRGRTTGIGSVRGHSLGCTATGETRRNRSPRLAGPARSTNAAVDPLIPKRLHDAYFRGPNLIKRPLNSVAARTKRQSPEAECAGSYGSEMSH